MKKILITFVVLLAVAAGTFWQLKGQSTANAAPEVVYHLLDGSKVTSADLRGKVVLVKFWATSCTTCIAQIPADIEAYSAFNAQGYETIAVAMDYDPPAYVRNFATSRNLPFPVAIDADGSIAKAFGDIKLTPTAFLIDKQGNIIKRYLGNYDKQAFLVVVAQALKG